MGSSRRELLAGIAGAGAAAVGLAKAAPPESYPVPPKSIRYANAIDKAQDLVQALIREKQIHGLSIAVSVDGAIQWSEGFGQADVEQRVAVTPLTRFRLGSVSKVLTAAGVAKLVQEGKLDLDAPVQRYVPEFPEKPWRITTRQLTSHTAGIRHYGDDFDGVLRSAPHFASIKQALTIFQNDPLLFEPGTNYAYSSYGWNLVSAVIEGASRQEFLTYMRRAVFEPLGLDSFAPDHVRAIIPFRTRFYGRDEKGLLFHAPYEDSSYKWAGGGFLGSAEDLVRFGSAHLQPNFLTQQMLDHLFTPQKLKSGKEVGVGIGWRVGTDTEGRRMLHHGGSISGGRAMFMLFPASKISVAMLANLFTDFGEAQARQIGLLFGA